MSEEPPDPGGSSPVVLVTDEQQLPVDVSRIEHVATRALEHLGIPGGAELAITLVDEERIAALKEDAFGERVATDVLSFPLDVMGEPTYGPLMLGDVVVCPSVAARQARALGIGFRDELDHLVVHGILHVLGRDHATPADEIAMVRAESELLEVVA